MVDVVDLVQRLAIARFALVGDQSGFDLVFARSRQGAEVTAAVEHLEDRGVEAGVATLDLTLLVLHPHEDVLRVKEVLTGLVLVGVITETQ